MDYDTKLQHIRKWDRIAWAASALVILLVALKGKLKLDLGISFHWLPPFYSSLNALCALFLVLSLLKIKARDVAGHTRYIHAALACSIVFLLSYVLYHFTTPETQYGGQGLIRIFYFTLLITHIILAALILPFILMAYIRGYWQDLFRHRKLAQWVWPLWFYVAVTGPVVYLMLRPYYAQP
jgi:putative membrane protein